MLLFQVNYANSVENSAPAYHEISTANISDSFFRIKNAPIKVYEFKYDTTKGRKHVGIIGKDVQRWFPEAVDIVPRYTVPSQNNKKEKTVLTNFPIVDKNVIFMHGVAALQDVISRYDILANKLSTLRTEHDAGEHIALFKEVERRLNDEAEEQLKEKALLAESEVELAQKRLELEKTKSGIDVKLIAQELSDEKALLTAQEEAFRKRISNEEDIEKRRSEAVLRMEHDLAMSRESLRKDTTEKLQLRKLELEKELQDKKQSLEKDKVRAEIEARSLQERSNQDIRLKKMKIQAELEGRNIVKGIETVFQSTAEMAMQIVANPSYLLWLMGVGVAMLAAYFAIKETSRALRELIMSALGRPRLVRETSVSWSILHVLPLPLLKILYSMFSRAQKLEASLKIVYDAFDNIILSENDKDRVVQMALTTRNAKNSNSAYRHLLLHGPPGTGKTLIARRLAEISGMDYAILSGGDVGPLGEDAVPQLHALFHWANRSMRGLLIFVDEAEAFLASRAAGHETGTDLASQGQRHALNALLYQTGTETKSFMLVLATNRPGDLDEAVVDRIDVSIRVGLPEQPQRQSLCRLYMQVNVISMLDKCSYFYAFIRYISKLLLSKDLRPSKRLDPSVVSEQSMLQLAKKTKGFSGREISKLMTAVRYAATLQLADVGLNMFNNAPPVGDSYTNIEEVTKNASKRSKKKSDTESHLGGGNGYFGLDHLMNVVDEKVAEHRERVEYEKTAQ